MTSELSVTMLPAMCRAPQIEANTHSEYGQMKAYGLCRVSSSPTPCPCIFLYACTHAHTHTHTHTHKNSLMCTTGESYLVDLLEGFLAAQLVKNPSAMQKTPVRFLSWEDPLEKGKGTQSSILAWRIPWTVKSMGFQRVRHN